ncbi:MAG: flagellar protein FlgA [Rhodocyclaceae bacterium]|nr:flagellar protein FlgA [Rhodocyclaceae bacterium]
MTRFILLLCLAVLGRLVSAATDPAVDVAERYARLQTQGLPGKVTIHVGSLDTRTQLPPCSAHEAFTPPGARLWGKTHIGVRCLGPNVWSVLIPVQITVTGQYVTTTRPLPAGKLIEPGDLATLSGDLAALPAGVVADPAAAIGKTLKNPLAAGQSVRSDQLLAPLVIRQGQTVRLVSRGPGFSVSGEGKAINNAAEGQVVQVRMPSGQVVSGIAKGDGSAEIAN